MCGFDKKLTECSYDELKHYRLAKSDEKIPLFDEVLKVIDGKVPLIVEVKSEGDWKKTTQLMAERMDSYRGCYCMESFHPFAVKWFKDHRPFADSFPQIILKTRLTENGMKNFYCQISC